MKVVTLGTVIGQQCYHHNPESKRHGIEVHSLYICQIRWQNTLIVSLMCHIPVMILEHSIIRTQSVDTQILPANPKQLHVSAARISHHQDACIRKCENKIRCSCHWICYIKRCVSTDCVIITFHGLVCLLV
jgi:hypothetical protein